MLEYILIIAFIALAGFYSGSEMGFYRLNRIRLHFLVEKGRPGATIIQRLSADPQLAISTMVVGTNVGVYLATVVCAHKLQGLGLHHWAEFYSTLLMTPLLLIFGDIVPKSLYQRHADTLIYKTAVPLGVSAVLFYPVSRFLRLLGSLPRFIFPSAQAERASLLTVERFHFLLSEGTTTGALSPYQKAMTDNILALKSRSLRDVMIPLEKVVMISDAAGFTHLVQSFREHAFSRIPVYCGERTRITAIVNLLDLACADGREISIGELSRPPHYLNASMSVAEALYSLRSARQQMGVVLDDGGRATGIVTIKDLVEEIVGDLRAW